MIENPQNKVQKFWSSAYSMSIKFPTIYFFSKCFCIILYKNGMAANVHLNLLKKNILLKIGQYLGQTDKKTRSL